MNLLVGLLLPIALKIRWLPSVYDAVFKGVYKYYDVKIDSLNEFLYYVYGKSYFLEYLILVAFFLLPFQLIKDYFRSRKIKLTFIQKWAILTGILILWVILWLPLGLNADSLKYFFVTIVFGFLFAGLLYLCIDQYEEKNKRPKFY